MGRLSWDKHLDASRVRRDALSAPETAQEVQEVRGDMFARPSGFSPSGAGTAAEPGVPGHMAERWQMVGSGRDPERGRYLVYIDRQAAEQRPPF